MSEEIWKYSAPIRQNSHCLVSNKKLAVKKRSRRAETMMRKIIYPSKVPKNWHRSKDGKSFIITIFHRFKKLCSDIEDIKMTQIKHPEEATIMHEIKNSLDGINSRLDIAEKVSELEDIVLEPI